MVEDEDDQLGQPAEVHVGPLEERLGDLEGEELQNPREPTGEIEYDPAFSLLWVQRLQVSSNNKKKKKLTFCYVIKK